MAAQSDPSVETVQVVHQSGRPRLSAREYLKLSGKALTIVPFRMVLSILRILFFSARHGYNMKHYLFCGIVEVVFSSFNDREVQVYSLPTVDAYHQWVNDKLKCTKEPALRQKLIHEIQPLDETGGSLLWIGNRRKASKIVLLFHGGGYVAPALKAHYEWAWNAYIQAGKETGVDVAVGCLQYTLLEAGRFPVPLTQAAAALGSLLDAGIKPSNIYIGGDSAGGNLSVQVLGHILHPHEQVRRLELSEPLAGVFLASPFLSNNTSTESFHRNNGHDMVSVRSMNRLGALLYGEEMIKLHKANVLAGDYSGAIAHMTPLDTDESFLDGIETTTASVYLTVGKNEILYDQGVNFVKLIQRKNAAGRIKITFEEAEREAHDFILIENLFCQPGDATRRMKNWFKTAISS